MKRSIHTACAAVVAAAMIAGCAREAGPTAAGERTAPLFSDLGDHHHPITTDSAEAQRFFDQGLILTYGFNHAEAIRSFREAARLDPRCAMCYWGIALAYGPNINAPMEQSAVPEAWQATQNALELAPETSAAERAYIEALASRYAPEPVEDRSSLDRAFADAMRTVVERFPDDLDAATLYAEAMMDTTPWSYWGEDGAPTAGTEDLIPTLESVLARHSDHPGAIHLYIHAVESTDGPSRAESGADRLAGLVPGAGHLVHMPSHIYLRVGRYEDASLANERAAAADESYIAQCNAQGFYPALYYPHNIHFLWYSASLEGRGEVSIAAARKLAANVSDGMIREFPQLESFRAIPHFGLVRFGRWDEILASPQPAAELQYETAMWRYARGLALAARGRLDEATAEAATLDAFVGSADAVAFDMTEQQFPGHRLLEIANHVLAAEVAGRGGDGEEQIQHLREAVALQDELPYMEPPYWYYPVRQSLGVALLEQGRAAEAETVYREDLGKVPRNGWSLFGLARSLELQGRTGEAVEVRARFDEAWARADVRLDASVL